jgi:hypothetical protein
VEYFSEIRRDKALICRVPPSWYSTAFATPARTLQPQLGMDLISPRDVDETF